MSFLTDGQKIATRISKKISSTTSTLKRSLNRFNTMRPDSLEHTAYSLPSQLSWDSVKNLEELSSLEVTSTLAKSSTVPINLWLKAVRASNMKKRSIEEQQLVAEEMKTVEFTLCEEHSLIMKHILHIKQCEQYNELSRFQVGCVHLLYERLLLCEASMQSFSQAVREYHCVKFPEMLILDHYSLLCASIDDGHDSDYHFTDHEDVDVNSSDSSDYSSASDSDSDI